MLNIHDNIEGSDVQILFGKRAGDMDLDTRNTSETDAQTVKNPFLYMSYHIDRINLKRAFRQLQKHVSSASDYSKMYKKMKLLRLLLISLKLRKLTNWQDQTIHNHKSSSYSRLCSAWGTWKRKMLLDRRYIRIPGYVHSVRLRKRSKMIRKLVLKRVDYNNSLLRSAFKCLKFHAGTNLLQSKLYFESFLEERIAMTKISARKIRSKSNNMMIEFRKNFNSKTAVMENLLKKREELADLKRGAEIMRLKADELATKLRDWKLKKKTSDFLHYDTVEKLASKGKNIYI